MRHAMNIKMCIIEKIPYTNAFHRIYDSMDPIHNFKSNVYAEKNLTEKWTSVLKSLKNQINFITFKRNK